MENLNFMKTMDEDRVTRTSCSALLHVKLYVEHLIGTQIGIALVENVIVINFNYRLGPFGFLANIE